MRAIIKEYIEQCSCKEFTSPCLTFSKIGVVLHLGVYSWNKEIEIHQNCTLIRGSKKKLWKIPYRVLTPPPRIFVRTDESEDRACKSLERYRVIHLGWSSCIPSLEAGRERCTNFMLKSLEEKNILRYHWILAPLNLLEVKWKNLLQ